MVTNAGRKGEGNDVVDIAEVRFYNTLALPRPGERLTTGVPHPNSKLSKLFNDSYLAFSPRLGVLQLDGPWNL